MSMYSIPNRRLQKTQAPSGYKIKATNDAAEVYWLRGYVGCRSDLAAACTTCAETLCKRYQKSMTAHHEQSCLYKSPYTLLELCVVRIVCKARVKHTQPHLLACS
ncbi:hypothetical protein HMPREF9248_0638 [Fannyhessea vaginae PB189-T1-4]|uniref:Transposase DDE domain-containing protein n=1 Tax=Fannyhessea vaginae PB189-T1-4 TaxID=866774 RepID=A0ABN0B1G5_9ACTN|nr:hypothetical protein HMPREF9248_0638 [Fannyhessea vaginae PB189-T1-4]